MIAMVEQLERHVAKSSLQISLNIQILNHKAILELCQNEMMSIKIFGNCKESMFRVENFEIGKWYEGEDTAPVTRNSHHLVPFPTLQTCRKPTSEDESYVDIQSINLCDLCVQVILVGWHD